MSEPKRQHPVAGISQLLNIVRQNWITLLVLLFLGTGSESSWGLYAVLGFSVLGAIGGLISWWRFTYHIENGELHIKQGIFVRKQLYLAKERIQVIDITAGVLQRMFDLVSVEVKTAGSTSKEAKIEAVTRPEAERLKRLLRTDKVTEDEEVPVTDIKQVYRLSFKELLFAAATSGNLGVTLSVVAGAYSQVDQIIDQDRMMQFFEWLIPTSVGVSLIFSTIIFILVVSWILSILGTLIKHYDFTVVVKDDELLIKRGLFEQKQLTIPFNRIQAVQIKEELLRQPFGYASIILESAGYSDEQQALNSTTLYPFLKKEEVGRFIKQVIPEYHTSVATTRPPVIAMRRYMLRMVWASLILIIPIWVFVPYGIYSLLLLIPALALGYAQYRDAMIGVSGDDTLMIQSRLLSRTTAIVKKYRIQSAQTQQNPFQRRLDLLSYEVTVTSGSGGQTFAIRELSEYAGAKLLEWNSGARPVCQNNNIERSSLPRN